MELMMNSNINWEKESYPVYQDFLALPFFAIFFPSVRFFLDRLIFEKLARRVILGPGFQKIDIEKDDDRRKKVYKFKESAWKLVYYLSAEFLALLVTYNEPWFLNTRKFWVGPGENQIWPDLMLKLKLKGLYMYAGGFYAYSIFALMFWETRRKDFSVTMVHHVATLILIVLSYIIGFARVGSVVLALHDGSDVFLEVAKMSKYGGFDKMADAAFRLFALSWVALRILLYPFWILRSTSYEVLQMFDHDKHPVEGPIYYYVFNTLLFCLYVLHIYWGVLILRMVQAQSKAKGRLSDDVRSDSEGEEDEHED
ncbi:hypothetical protein MKW92_018878 [Papaver armeniacum]|nr:hypothetical protein MKW92_018878 [Papaver armeniacum]